MLMWAANVSIDNFSPTVFLVTYGYSPVVRIPRGATHIRVTDNSSNYLGTSSITFEIISAVGNPDG